MSDAGRRGRVLITCGMGVSPVLRSGTRNVESTIPMPSQTPINRRKFFREGLRELLRPLASAVEPLEKVIRELQAGNAPAPPRRVALDVWLRPPGALVDQDFLNTCSRCGECARVCPAQCIKIDPTAAKGNGAPFIEVNSMPCVVCDGLYCMHGCPSGALIPTALADIHMGTALWNEETCMRGDGEECTICIDQCPLGSAAIELRAGRIHVIEEGCIGCGVCQYYCPTNPKSIAVIPKAAAISSW